MGKRGGGGRGGERRGEEMDGEEGEGEGRRGKREKGMEGEYSGRCRSTCTMYMLKQKYAAAKKTPL